MTGRFSNARETWDDWDTMASNLEMRSGSSTRRCVERNRESSTVSWNAVGAFTGCRFTVEWSQRGSQSVEEMTRVLLFDLSSRVRGPISVHSPVSPWIFEHTTDILNKCHVASDGKSAFERLKKRPHRGGLLPFRASMMFRRVDGKVPGGLMTERWHLGTWLGKRFHTEENIVLRKGDGLVIRCRAVKAILEPTTMDDLDAMKGSPWAPSGVDGCFAPMFHVQPSVEMIHQLTPKKDVLCHGT